MIRDKIQIVFKGILLYTTVIAVIIFSSGIGSICDRGYFFYSVATLTILIYSCYKTLNAKDLERILPGDNPEEVDEDEWLN